MSTIRKAKRAERIVVGYCRVSTDKQAEHGVSMEAQQSKIRAMSVVQGVTVAEMLVDAAESAKDLCRPAMGRLLRMVDAGQVRTIIIAKLDRLTRSVKDLGELLERFERKGVALVSVAESLDTQSAAGRLVLNVMASVSQWERETIGERTRDALRHKRGNGQVYCRIAPYGFERDGDKLVQVPAEQAVLCRMRKCREQGMSFSRIAETLNAEGIPTKQAGQWYAMTVRDILRNTLHQTAAA